MKGPAPPEASPPGEARLAAGRVRTHELLLHAGRAVHIKNRTNNEEEGPQCNHPALVDGLADHEESVDGHGDARDGQPGREQLGLDLGNVD